MSDIQFMPATFILERNPLMFSLTKSKGKP